MMRVGLILLGLAGIALPAGFAAAHVFPHDCCPSCSLPATTCVCQTVRPVVETSYRQQQVVTYQNVAETHLRQEHVVQRVPVTRLTNVTVDEGNYQMVWVSRPVTRQVATTECIDQVVSRTVPVTVQRTVPYISTHLVPQQTVRYVAQQHAVTVAAPPVVTCASPAVAIVPPIFATQPACPSCVAPFTASIPPMTLPSVTSHPATSAHAHRHHAPRHDGHQHTAGLYEQSRLPHTAMADGPVPDANFSSSATGVASRDGWTTIGPRSAPTRAAAHPGPYDDRTGVPSAAAVWQSNGNVRR